MLGEARADGPLKRPRAVVITLSDGRQSRRAHAVRRRCGPFLGAVLASLIAGCLQTDLAVRPTGLPAVAALPVSLLPHARSELAAGHRLEHRGWSECVDRYYEAAVYSFAAIRTTSASVGSDHPDTVVARELYNESLRDCLRSAQQYGRVDPGSHLLVNTAAGSQTIPILHRGFVWSNSDFSRLVDPTRIRRNPHQNGMVNFRQGVGADLAFGRINPRVTASDKLLPREAAFNATAVLRPDLDAWLGPRRGSHPADRLELLDPLRVTTVDLGDLTVPLAGNYDASNALAYEIQARRGPFALAGFAMPGQMLDKADIRMLEPYQPGKMPLMLIHGLLDDPFIFSVMIAALNRTPGFLDRYQIWVYRYPTGLPFLRSAALLRSDLREALTTVDPESRDPALRNIVLAGYSMGGLLSRLQVTSSGNRLWDLAAKRPLDSLVMEESTRSMLRDLFYFEPSPNIRRVIFIATPHEGSPIASSIIGRMASRIIQPPPEGRETAAQIAQDNPGVLNPLLERRLPSSIEMLRQGNQLSPVLPQMPFSPSVTLHTIAGHGRHPPDPNRGDMVVPLSSAHVDGAVSELWVPATHTNIYYHPQTIAEVQRILVEHAALSRVTTVLNVP